jgi:putative tricarboxylic transport membrane protein
VTAVLIGALLIQGIDPGPFFIIEHGDLFAQILLILLVAALMTLVLGLGARRILPKILRIPARILLPVIAVLCATGGFAINNAPFEVGLIAVLGIVGYLLARFGFPMAPIVIGLVLGPIIEVNLRNGLVANDMDLTVFFTRPISAALLIAIVLALGWSVWRRSHADVNRR